MKKVILLFCLGFYIQAQAQTIKEVEDKLVMTYTSFKAAYGSDSYELKDSLMQVFTKQLKDALTNNSGTFTYSFKRLKDSTGITILDSDDKKFRVYCWDTEGGGTMHFYETVYQYKTSIGVKTEQDTLTEGDPGAAITEIITIKSKQKNYYLTLAYGRYSTKDLSQCLKIYDILNDKKVNANIIKTSQHITNTISFQFDFFSVVDHPERPLKLIKYDKTKQQLYIPIVVENGKVTNRFIEYKFDGEYFSRIQKQKKK